MNIIQYNNDNNDAIKSINKEIWVCELSKWSFSGGNSRVGCGSGENVKGLKTSVGYINQIVTIVCFLKEKCQWIIMEQ